VSRTGTFRFARRDPALVLVLLFDPVYEQFFSIQRKAIRLSFTTRDDLLPLLQSSSFELRLAAQFWALLLPSRSFSEGRRR
jgi:hypothetical protein